MSLLRTVLFVRIVSINLVYNAKLVKQVRVKDARFPGELVIMLIIHIVLASGLHRRRLNAHYARMCGIRLRLPRNEVDFELL
jgi:hypothetical protein